MHRVETFEAERPRLLALAGRVLGDHAEAEDVVQQAWAPPRATAPTSRTCRRG